MASLAAGGNGVGADRTPPRATSDEAALRLVTFVNSPGLQARRAEALASNLPNEITTDVIVAPTPRTAAEAVRSADCVYVIDPGKRGFPAALTARALRKPVIVEIGDPQAALYRAQGRSALEVAAGALIDRMVGLTASALVYRGRELVQSIVPRVPWIVLPDGVDVEVFRPGGGDALRRELGISEDVLVAGVVGTIAWSPVRRTAYGLDLVEALGMLPDDPVHALVVGGGDGLSHLRSRAADLKVTHRVTFTDSRPHAEIPGLLNAMDVCVSTQTNDAIGRGRTTAKLPEYLACDRHVLATDVGTASEILPREMVLPFASSVDDGHPRRLAAELAALVPRRQAVRSGAGTRNLALEHFDYRVLASRLEALLRQVGTG